MSCYLCVNVREATPKGWFTRIGNISGSKTWAHVAWISELEGKVVIRGKNGNALIMPSRAFPSTAERQHFLNDIRQWHKQYAGQQGRSCLAAFQAGPRRHRFEAVDIFEREIEMARNLSVVSYVVVLIAVVVSVDFLFFKNRFWERLIVNIGIVLVFAAFYLRFLKAP
jgi:hypothetical protein